MRKEPGGRGEEQRAAVYMAPIIFPHHYGPHTCTEKGEGRRRERGRAARANFLYVFQHVTKGGNCYAEREREHPEETRSAFVEHASTACLR